MDIIADNQVTVGHGFPEEADESRLAISLTDERTGEPVQIFIYPDIAREILLHGLSDWVSPSERKDIIGHFIR